jgi:DNA processing protein
MDAAALRAWLAFLRLPGIGPATGAQLLDRYGDPAAVFAAAGTRRNEDLPAALREALSAPDWEGADTDLAWLDRPNCAFVHRDDARYPPRLREFAQAPLALFCIGDPALLKRPQLAVVGARHATPQGNDNAKAFAAELAGRGLVITSGLALGIDGAAHRGALEAKGLTLAVCGNGLDRVYPARHRELAHRIAESGLLVSEFPPGTPPKPENFPRRNRIISGLALGVLVVEAARESGSLITARLAAEQGREVFAIPGSIHNPMARGCHQLIRDGARLVETVDDILEEIAPQLARISAPVTAPPSAAGTDDVRSQLLNALGDEPVPFDALVTRSGLDAAVLNALLLELELSGDVAPAGGDRFMRRFQAGS